MTEERRLKVNELIRPRIPVAGDPGAPSAASATATAAVKDAAAAETLLELDESGPARLSRLLLLWFVGAAV